MSQKRGKGKSGKHNKNKKQGGDDSYGLQAIILADSYSHKRFRPLTHSIPKMLIPLAGCPMINYSIDLLTNSNVNEIYIICSSHAQQLEDYIHSSQWMNKHWFPKLKIHIERIPLCQTVGAALRHMHNLNYIQSNTFILCHGDCVANISLTNNIKKHQERYKNSTSTLMTCLFKNASHKQRSTSLEDDLFIVTNDNNELLQYSNDRLRNNLSFDLSIFDDIGNEEIEINHNIIDCGIDICSKTVLSLFEDNFDYDCIRGEQLSLFEGVIRSEIYNYKIYADILHVENEYAVRILDWRSYAGISTDIIERWTYPLVLDSNTVSHNYIFERNNIYKEDNVKIGLQSLIKQNTILGYNVVIGNKCTINKCVIGANCTIGNRTEINNSFIFGDCFVGNNCVLNGVVMANNVVIGNNCHISKGCILSFGVEIDHNMSLKAYTKVTAIKADTDQHNDDGFDFDSDHGQEQDDAVHSVQLPKQQRFRQSPKGRVRALSQPNKDMNEKENINTIMGIIDGADMNDVKRDECNESAAYDIEIVGKNGKGFLYEIAQNDESFVLDSINNVLANECDRPQRGHPMITDTKHAQKSLSVDIIIDAPIGNGNGDANMNVNHIFDQKKLVQEISDCISSAENNKSINFKMDDVVFEITTSVRLSHNASLEEFSCAVFLVILNNISDDLPFQSKKTKIEYYCQRYCCLFEKLAKNEEEEIKVIIGLYNACQTRQNGLIYFFLEGLDKLFYEDIVSLQSIQKWNQKRGNNNENVNDQKFAQYLEQYIEGWIDADCTDDDEDDDEESD